MHCMETMVYNSFAALFVGKNFTKYINIKGYLWRAPSQDSVTERKFANLVHSFEF